MSKKLKPLFFLFITLYFIGLAILIYTTPLSPSEAKLFFKESFSPTIKISKWLYNHYHTIFSLRVFIYLLSLINAYLYWQVLRDYFKKEQDRVFAFSIYLLLPGVIASAVILNEALYAFMMVLIFLLAYKRGLFYLEALAMVLLLFSPTATFAFYGAIALYGYRRDEKRLLILGSILFIASLIFGAYKIGGHPNGHFLELLGVYMALFSPLFFIYYLYSLYRISWEGERNIYWYISWVAMVFSIALSIRQQVLITDFSSYLLAGAMLPIALYLRTLRVRLRRFQTSYRLMGSVVVAGLIFSSLMLFFHRPIYRLLNSPSKFFVAPLYYPYDLANRLKQEGRGCYPPTIKSRYQKLMLFYSLKPCKYGD